MGIYSEVRVITPAMAAEMLKRNTANRKVSRSNVLFLKKQLLDEGKWILNGESIKLAEDGEILDGQHRLIACVESGVNLETVVMLNVPKQSKHTMDTGRNRAASDVLSFTLPNSKYISLISQAAKFVISFQKERYSYAIHDSGSNSGSKAIVPDNTDVLRFVSETEGFVEFVEMAAKLQAEGDKCVNSQIFIGLYWVISQKYPKNVADKFFRALATGENLESDNPIFAFRRKMIQSKTSNDVTALRGKALLWSLVKIFVYWIEGKKAKSIHYISEPIKF